MPWCRRQAVELLEMWSIQEQIGLGGESDLSQLRLPATER